MCTTAIKWARQEGRPAAWRLWSRQACALRRFAMHHMWGGMHHALQPEACSLLRPQALACIASMCAVARRLSYTFWPAS